MIVNHKSCFSGTSCYVELFYYYKIIHRLTGWGKSTFVHKVTPKTFPEASLLQFPIKKGVRLHARVPYTMINIHVFV